MTSASEYGVFPDAEALAGYVLREGPSPNTYSSLPKNAESKYPLTVVERVGGIPVEEHRVDRARLQLKCYGANKGEARELVAQCRLAFMLAQGETFTVNDGAPVDAVITGAEDVSGPRYSPDPVTHRECYFYEVALTLHEYP